MSSESRIWEIRPFGSMRGGSALVIGHVPFNPTAPAYSTTFARTMKFPVKVGGPISASSHPCALTVLRLSQDLVSDGDVLSHLEVEHSHHSKVGAAGEGVFKTGPWPNRACSQDLVSEPGTFQLGEVPGGALRIQT